MKHIDVAASIQKSNSDFLKKLPRFLIRIVEKVVKQDEINAILNKYADAKGAEFQRGVATELNITIKIDGLENLPESGRCFFAANHPFGIIDGMVLTKTLLEKYGDLRAIGNDAFLLIPNLRPYIAMVNVYGRSSRESIAELDKIYNSDLPISHFPAGEVSRRYHGRIQDCDWQKSFISKAVSCKRDIVPFYFHGRNSLLFYSINLFRRALGIKLNIELMLLPSELFKKKNKTVRLTIGHPICWEKFDNSSTHQQWAQKVKAYVYGLKENGPHGPEFK
ncbi:MAG: glycerol acyltransferase [Bacteroidetes bacterium]|nr:glycerol acyltransferase [Bacteroidota bacterium]